MASFDTPEPITAVFEIGIGDIRLRASDRVDTVVEVRPTDSSKVSDVAAAKQVRVNFSRGKLQVKTDWRLLRRSSASPEEGGSVEVSVELPEGSQVRGGSAWAGLYAEGRLGECQFETVESDILLDQTGPLRLTAISGDITVARMTGHGEITKKSGTVRIGEIEGSAVIKNDHGANSVGEVTGTLRVTGANGDIDITRAYGGVEAKTASGCIRIGEVRRGLVLLTAASGDVEVGIREGSAVKYDVSTVFGTVHNELDSAEGPGDSVDVVEVRVRTFDGDVAIRRSE
ncbi:MULTISPECIES: DUF4097 family beta strand repeat-containing protein [unclassified Streptomyces]|uniref:DUF4097 family beta strand repeat-containing protein n=1 Tax=unclassified Streptomyces TaxID=2593676 RepID=UPI002E28B9B9|nr:DUF4097 family beta strand repeat-containing protein [Streptomyces sp. NBC_00690]